MRLGELIPGDILCCQNGLSMRVKAPLQRKHEDGEWLFSFLDASGPDSDNAASWGYNGGDRHHHLGGAQVIQQLVGEVRLRSKQIFVTAAVAMAEGPGAVTEVNEAISDLRYAEVELRRLSERCKRQREQLEGDPRLLRNQLAASIAQVVTK